MPRRHLRRASALLAKHYKLGCSGLQSKQVHFKAQAAYSVQANPTGALVYQQSSAVQNAAHTPSHSGSIVGHAPLSSSHSFAAQPYMRSAVPRTHHARASALPSMSSTAFPGARPVRFRPPCFSARPFSQRSHPHPQQQPPPAISPIPARILRSFRLPGSPGPRQSVPAAPHVSESSPLWGLSQLSSRHRSSSHGGWSYQSSLRPHHRAGFGDCVSHPASSQNGRQHCAIARHRDGEDLWGRRRHGGSGQRMTAFQAGLAELCNERHAQHGNPWPGRGQDAWAARHSQTADLTAGLTYLSSRRNIRSSQLARQHLGPSRPSPTARRVTQSHGGLDRLAYAMHYRSQAAGSSSSNSRAVPQRASSRCLDRHRVRQQRNRAALSTLQTIFE